MQLKPQELTHDNLDQIIEKPLVKAVRILHAKNIETITASTGGENGPKNACLFINFQALSPANRLIAQKLIRKGLINFDPSYRVGASALGITLESQDNLPLIYHNFCHKLKFGTIFLILIDFYSFKFINFVASLPVTHSTFYIYF